MTIQNSKSHSTVTISHTYVSYKLIHLLCLCFVVVTYHIIFPFCLSTAAPIPVSAADHRTHLSPSSEEKGPHQRRHSKQFSKRQLNSNGRTQTQQRATYHQTDALLTKIWNICEQCLYADAEWTTISTSSNSWKIPPMFNYLSSMLSSKPTDRIEKDSLLTVTLTHNAASRNAARRAGGLVTPRLSVVAIFGEHGRERITSELALRIIEQLCDVNHKNKRSRDETMKLLQSIEIILLPVANVSGRKAVEAGHDCWRLNGRGVDLNRNYARGWGMHDSDTVLEEEHCGRSPLSEFESKGIDAVVKRFSADAYISIHSGDVAVLPPWDGYGEDQTIHPTANKAARVIADRHCNGPCIVGRANQAFGYRAYGTGVDHMHSERGVNIALTVEIWGGDESQCETMFNPSTASDYEKVMNNWSGVLQTVGGYLMYHQNEGQVADNVKSMKMGIANDILKVPGGWADKDYVVHWMSDEQHQREMMTVQKDQKRGYAYEVRRYGSLMTMTLIALSFPIAHAIRSGDLVTSRPTRYRPNQNDMTHPKPGSLGSRIMGRVSRMNRSSLIRF